MDYEREDRIALQNAYAAFELQDAAWQQQLLSLLADLNPEIQNDTLCVGKVRIWLDTNHARQQSVLVRGLGKPRRFRTIAPDHIATQVRKLFKSQEV
jgi:hypothetical protein